MCVCVCVCVCVTVCISISISIYIYVYHHHYHHHHQSPNREGRWDTTDDFAISFLHFSLFSTALWDLPNSRSVHSLMLSSHLFLCPPCLHPPFTVLCKMVLAKPDGRENMTKPLQFVSLYDRQEIFVWSSCLLDLSTDLLVGNRVFCMSCVVSCGSTSFPWLVFFFGALL